MFWLNCCHNHLIWSPQRKEIPDSTSLTVLLACLPILPLSLCPCSVLLSKAVTSSLLLVFILSSLCVLHRILICLSGDTNWKIAGGSPWAPTPTVFLLISGSLRKLVKRVVTDTILLCPSVPLSHILSWCPLVGHTRMEGDAAFCLTRVPVIAMKHAPHRHEHISSSSK